MKLFAIRLGPSGSLEVTVAVSMAGNADVARFTGPGRADDPAEAAIEHQIVGAFEHGDADAQPGDVQNRQGQVLRDRQAGFVLANALLRPEAEVDLLARWRPGRVGPVRARSRKLGRFCSPSSSETPAVSNGTSFSCSATKHEKTYGLIHAVSVWSTRRSAALIEQNPPGSSARFAPAAAALPAFL